MSFRGPFAIALMVLAMLLPARPAFALDANLATRSQLEGIRGIGPALAERIVGERRRGRFRDLGDLRDRVRGIGDANLRKMTASGLTVDGSSRVPPAGAARAGEGRAQPSVREVPPRAEPAVGRGR